MMNTERPYAFIGRFTTFRHRIVSDIILCSPDAGNPNSTRVRALWDTGCSHSIISRRVADFLNLKESGQKTYRTPFNVSKVCDMSAVKVCVVLGGIRVPLETGIQNYPNSDPDCDITLGLDFITQGDFAITHEGEALTLSFCYPPIGYPVNFALLSKAFMEGNVETEEFDIDESNAVEYRRRGLIMLDYFKELAKKANEKKSRDSVDPEK